MVLSIPIVPAKMADALDVLERALTAIRAAQRELAVKNELIDNMARKLRMLQHRGNAQMSNLEAEISRRRSAERRVEELEELLASEIEAREASESARQTAENRFARAETQYHQAAAAWDIANKLVGEKERALASAEEKLENMTGSASSRFEVLKIGKELDERRSQAITLAAESLFLRQRAPGPRGKAHPVSAVTSSAAVCLKVARLQGTLRRHFKTRGESNSGTSAITPDQLRPPYTPLLSLPHTVDLAFIEQVSL